MGAEFPGTGGGGGAPSGAAGGDLAGSSYPNPTIAAGVVTSSKILDGAIVAADISATAAIAKSQLAALAIVDADVSAISESKITNLVSDLALKAPLASPALTGSPTAPTQTAGDNSTKLATTAYVNGLIGRGTSFPGSPFDTQLFVITADATNGVEWLFMYRAGSGSTFKWEFVGGPPMVATVNNAGVTGTGETTTSTSYVALATAGPSITLPAIQGDFMVEIGANANNASNAGVMSYDVAAAGASDNDCFWFGFSSSYANHNGVRLKTGLAASTAFVCKYRVLGSTADFRNRWMRITPVRCL